MGEGSVPAGEKGTTALKGAGQSPVVFSLSTTSASLPPAPLRQGVAVSSVSSALLPAPSSEDILELPLLQGMGLGLQ